MTAGLAASEQAQANASDPAVMEEAQESASDHSYGWDSTEVVGSAEVRALETQQTEAVQRLLSVAAMFRWSTNVP